MEVEAIQYLPKNNPLAFFDIQDFVGKALIPYVLHPGEGTLGIQTLEGVMHISPGDYIVKGIKDEFWPVKPDIFLLTYRPICEYCSEVGGHSMSCSVAYEEIRDERKRNTNDNGGTSEDQA